ncbi:Aste57867_12083 [Aphanomyces stellatus]|uniref:Aste57867_12083 protein n=1 Tax=Aphanomyces stellatus TaxID=120398 RepID=A0A485KV30_9STRA|nr:hypothetical protein As57867_012038 [Aphanomyces stellatus]VFT88938.1 Aste57867_12083 [Aphanomyces stellatus]
MRSPLALLLLALVACPATANSLADIGNNIDGTLLRFASGVLIALAAHVTYNGRTAMRASIYLASFVLLATVLLPLSPTWSTAVLLVLFALPLAVFRKFDEAGKVVLGAATAVCFAASFFPLGLLVNPTDDHSLHWFACGLGVFGALAALAMGCCVATGRVGAREDERVFLVHSTSLVGATATAAGFGVLMGLGGVGNIASGLVMFLGCAIWYGLGVIVQKRLLQSTDEAASNMLQTPEAEFAKVVV